MRPSERPSVSAVIPLFNKEREVKRALCSVLAQTEPPVAVLVVDDGSTDRGSDIVRGMHDDRIHLVCQENQGPSTARNRGIEEAPTELVALLDADDSWHPDLIESLLNLHAKHPEAGMWCANFEVIGEDAGWRAGDAPSGAAESANARSEIHAFSGVPKAPEGGLIPDFFKSALKMPPLCCSGVLLSKTVLHDVGGFPEGVRLGEDFDLWIRIAARYPVAYTSRALVTYHKNASNRAMNRERYPARDTCICRTLKRILAEGSFPYTKRRSVVRLLGSHLLDVSNHAFYVERNMPLCRELVREVWSYRVWPGRCIRRMRKTYQSDLKRILRRWLERCRGGAHDDKRR